ncbi:MAG TPA: substrate-binding domain-containing protein [Marinagarivorans sp.]
MRHFAAFAILHRTLALALFTLASATASAGPAPFERTAEGLLFTLAGSNTVGARLAPSWAKAYLESKGAQGVFIESLSTPNEYRVKGRHGTRMVFIDVRAHGSSTGFKSLKARSADIALSSRPIKDSEASAFGDGQNMRAASTEHVVAIDGLAVIVNPNNRVTELTVEQIAKIFAGKINNWKALGGPDRVINIYARDDKSGTFDTFDSLVLGKAFSLSPRAKRYESNDELSDSVARDLSGIGFVGLASVRNAKALEVSDNNTAALAPKVLFVATEDYPLSRRLYMYTRGQPHQRYVKDFIAFAQGSKGQDIVETIGFVSQNPKSITVAVEEGPEQYQSLAKLGQRLSINFRFQPGKADLDNKALRDVERLAQHVKSLSRVSGSEAVHIQLVGFSNVESTDKRAQVLSSLRATAVKSALFRFGVRTESVMGFGDHMRVASASGSASAKNERVEVWLFNDEHLSAVDAIKAQIKSADYRLPATVVSASH